LPEVPQEPPEALGSAHRAVRDHEHSLADSRPGSSRREVVRMGKRMPSSPAGRGREVLVHVEKRRARNVPLEVELAPTVPVTKVPATIDELVAHECSVTRTSPGGVLDRDQKGAVMKPIRIAAL